MNKVQKINNLLEQGGSAQEIIRCSYDAYGENLVMSTSFGAHSALMLHLATQEIPNIPVIFIDTGYLFPETYRFAQELKQRLSLNLKVFSPEMTSAMFEALYGKLWEQGEEGIQKYLDINKVEPMKRALKQTNAKAWMAGLRAEQSNYRASLSCASKKDNQIKIHPILRFTQQDVDDYLKKHSLPYHPLYHKGYRSIGDWHSTKPTPFGTDPRDGRLLGEKKECGIHLTT